MTDSTIKQISTMPYSNTIAVQGESRVIHPANMRINQLFKTGQILHATVLSSQGKGQVTVQIGSQMINATTRFPLSAQQRIAVEVIKTSPDILLQTLPGKPDISSTVDPLRSIIPRLIKRQSGWPTLLNLVSAMTQYDRADPVMRLLANNLLRAIPGRSSLMTAEGLQAAIQQSGLFAEAQLKTTSKKQSVPDLKGLLGLYIQALRDKSPGLKPMSPSRRAQENKVLPIPLPGRLPITQHGIDIKPATVVAGENANLFTLIEELQGTIARITLHQVNSAINFKDAFPLWQLEIPVQHGSRIDVLSLNIQKGKSHDADTDDPAWKLNFAIKLPDLGDIQAQVNLHRQSISTIIWCDLKETAVFIDQYLSRLEARLRDLGITITTIKCLHGHPDDHSRQTQHPLVVDCIA